MKLKDSLVLAYCSALDKSAWLSLWGRFALNYSAGTLEKKNPELARKLAKVCADPGSLSDEGKVRDAYCQGKEARILFRADHLGNQALAEWADDFLSRAKKGDADCDPRWVWHLLSTSALSDLKRNDTDKYIKLCEDCKETISIPYQNADNYYLQWDAFNADAAGQELETLIAAALISKDIPMPLMGASKKSRSI